MSISKRDLSQKLKKELSLKMETTDLLVDEFFQVLKKSLRESKTVKLSGFGTFEVFQTKPRLGRNPKTMEVFPILSRDKVRFTATKKAKSFLN
ncbi:HU family DNA-binding protein [Gammaproteobacteria bacterium]|jgi:integration host factor subunit alpha|nr:HU family DNA-binding protein [Gammaproteobacteria bacterium]|tara:strand:- start:190 stop:468 length:279 start_codon:yes stop_codon:yes gene_type:complete